MIQWLNIILFMHQLLKNIQVNGIFNITNISAQMRRRFGKDKNNNFLSVQVEEVLLSFFQDKNKRKDMSCHSLGLH